MIITTSIALVLVGLFTDFHAIPRLLRSLPQVTDWRLLRPIYYFLWGLAFLLAADSIGLVLTWIADGFPGVSWDAPLLGMAAYLAWCVRPPVALTRRIEGLRAMEHAVEDRPDWAKGGK